MARPDVIIGGRSAELQVLDDKTVRCPGVVAGQPLTSPDLFCPPGAERTTSMHDPPGRLHGRAGRRAAAVDTHSSGTLLLSGSAIVDCKLADLSYVCPSHVSDDMAAKPR